jgi:hypothetical protein
MMDNEAAKKNIDELLEATMTAEAKMKMPNFRADVSWVGIITYILMLVHIIWEALLEARGDVLFWQGSSLLLLTLYFYANHTARFASRLINFHLSVEAFKAAVVDKEGNQPQPSQPH